MKPKPPPPSEEVRRHIADIATTGTMELRTERGRTPSYCVRFRVNAPDGGPRRQRRITLGDDEEALRLVRTAISERVIKHRSDKRDRLAVAAARKKKRDDRY